MLHGGFGGLSPEDTDLFPEIGRVVASVISPGQP